MESVIFLEYFFITHAIYLSDLSFDNATMKKTCDIMLEHIKGSKPLEEDSNGDVWNFFSFCFLTMSICHLDLPLFSSISGYHWQLPRRE